MSDSKKYLPEVVRLDPILEGVKKTFKLEEEFRVFLDRNQDVRDSRPDVGFLLFLIEQQRMAIINLEARVTRLEKGTPVYGQSPAERAVLAIHHVNDVARIDNGK